MPANNALELTDINFDAIKSNLRNFLSNQSELGDYDYDSSTMQILLNLLSYNTYMNSYYLNMVGNEMFLDSAQIRSNVVSRAKMLGYTPRSAQGPSATVQVVITPNDSPDNITIDENTQFRSTIDGKQYIFVNPDAKVVNANADGIYSTNLAITEGRPLTFSYTTSTVNPVRYIIPNDNVDTRSLKVQVQETAANSNVTTYNLASNLTNITGNSNVYFLQENEEGNYELTFGDNILGRQLNDGNVLNITYRVCNGEDSDGASTFSSVSTIDGYSDITVNTVQAATGGGSKESIQSVKFNAPKSYEAQGRAVVSKDYENIIKSQFSNIQAVSVWGGELNTPPVYGRVYIAVKPRNGIIISDDEKVDIESYLSERNVLSIEPIVTDPTYLYVIPTVNVKYNPDLTSVSSSSLANSIASTIINYEANFLGLFNKDFISSDLIKQVDKVSESITSISIDLRIMKTLTPSTTLTSTYTIPFNRPLLNISGGAILRISPSAHPGRGLTIDSSRFTYEGQAGCKLDDDGFGNVRIYYVDTTGVRVYLNRLAGTVEYATGLVTLNNILISAYEGDFLKIYADPDTQDIDAIRNQIILITESKVDLFNNSLERITSTVSNINTQGQTASLPDNGILPTVF